MRCKGDIEQAAAESRHRYTELTAVRAAGCPRHRLLSHVFWCRCRGDRWLPCRSRIDCCMFSPRNVTVCLWWCKTWCDAVSYNWLITTMDKISGVMPLCVEGRTQSTRRAVWFSTTTTSSTCMSRIQCPGWLFITHRWQERYTVHSCDLCKLRGHNCCTYRLPGIYIPWYFILRVCSFYPSTSSPCWVFILWYQSCHREMPTLCDFVQQPARLSLLVQCSY